MAKTWILDTEAKGTGAHIVPLEEKTQPRAPEPRLSRVVLPRPPRTKPVATPDPPRHRLFKVLDVMTRETLAEGIDMVAALELLGEVRSSVDVHVYVWDGGVKRWRLLGLDEQRALWAARTSQSPPKSAASSDPPVVSPAE